MSDQGLAGQGQVIADNSTFALRPVFRWVFTMTTTLSHSGEVPVPGLCLADTVRMPFSVVSAFRCASASVSGVSFSPYLRRLPLPG